ncbi:hypothetical protein [Prevotella pallens]|uniref:hypothetical protein n=1 Tax=Prevotella pallens TaxID=60133 RepID=UPI0024906800|nr:hypothetical protein [Prevotella pallens]
MRTRCEHLVNVPLTPTKWGAKHSLIPHVHHEIGCETLRNSPRPPRNWGETPRQA